MSLWNLVIGLVIIMAFSSLDVHIFGEDIFHGAGWLWLLLLWEDGIKVITRKIYKRSKKENTEEEQV